MLFPVICPVCGAPGAAPCEPCAGAMVRAKSLPRPAGVDSCAALLDYSGGGRELVARLKYRNARASVRWLARSMAQLVDPKAVDVVTWAPTTPARRRARGFDQARLLAKAVARELGLPWRPLLKRRPGPPQTGRDLAGRLTGAAFAARGHSPRRVLLVDDIVTTGATVSFAARTLRAAGAREVHVVAAARTSRRSQAAVGGPGRRLRS